MYLPFTVFVILLKQSRREFEDEVRLRLCVVKAIGAVAEDGVTVVSVSSTIVSVVVPVIADAFVMLLTIVSHFPLIDISNFGCSGKISILSSIGLIVVVVL